MSRQVRAFVSWRRGARVVGAWVLMLSAAASGGLPRIAVQDGQFARAGGAEPFSFHGFNYIRTRDIGYLWHDTLNPARYDPQAVDAALDEIGRNGFNVVRLFIDHQAGAGVIESSSARRLSPAYMNNVVDFLRKATDHGVYVVPSLLYLPSSARYNEIIGSTPSNIQSENRYYLDADYIEAKATYVADFARAIADRDPSVLSTVLAYEMDNESHFRADRAPFTSTTGQVTTATGTYDLASASQKVQMADDGVRLWANTARAALREVDPEAMLTANVFTYRAVGRTGPTDWHTGGDTRMPVRPRALVASDLDYVDIHLYSLDHLPDHLASVEYTQLLAEARAEGTPLISGEVGIFKSAASDPHRAAQRIRDHLDSVYGYGFAGSMLWTYDCFEQDSLWNSRSGQGQMFNALIAAERKRTGAWGTLSGDRFDVADGRASGQAIDGVRSALGGVDWVASANVRLVERSGDGMLQRAGGTGQVSAVVPVTPRTGDSFLLAADVAVASGWAGVGFASTLAGTMNFSDAAQGVLWMRLQADGRFGVYAIGTNAVLAEGRLDPALMASREFHRLAVLFDAEEQAVTAWLDGTLVVEDAHLDGWRMTGARAAGVQFGAAGVLVDDFTLSLVPEPATAALLALGAALVVRRRARSGR